MSGLDARQLRDFVVKPALAALGLPGGLPMEKLVMGTGCHESDGFRYIHQLGKGPALSLWQVEPATARDALARAPVAALLGLRDMLGWSLMNDDEILRNLPGNLYLGAAMCRLVYYTKPFNLTDLRDGDLPSLWLVYKKYYNSMLGAAVRDQFVDNWNRCCSEIYP